MDPCCSLFMLMTFRMCCAVHMYTDDVPMYVSHPLD